MNNHTGALAKYLIRRGVKGRFYLRLAVPRPLHAAWGKRERIKALGTSDRDLAEHRAYPILAQWRAEEREALDRGSAPVTRRKPTSHDLEDAAVLIAHDLVRAEIDDRLKLFRSWDAELWDMQVGFLKDDLEVQRRATATQDFKLVSRLAEEVIAALDYDLPEGSGGYAKLCEYLNISRLAALKTAYRHAHGDIEAETESKLVRRVHEREAASAKPGETLLELFDRWAAESRAKGEKRADTITQDRKVIAHFAEFVGVDRGVRSVTAVEVAEYRDTLRDLPPKWSSKRELRGLSMRAAAAKARELDLPQTAFTTINKHLSTISPLYTWLAEQPAWAGLVNPCNGLHHKRVKGKNPRPPFSTAVLNEIIQSPLFTGFLADGKEHLPGDKQADDWRKWIPLVAMFTGARIGEVVQLRIGDVRQDRDVWFIHIMHDEGAGLTTKSGKSRPAAVHSILEKMGFLAFHARRQTAAGDDQNAPLFPEIVANGRGQMSGKPSRWWRDYLEGIGVKNGADGYGAHSFRHTLADRMRSEAEMLDDEIEVALGHNQKTTTSNYGELSQGTVSMFKGWMDRVAFDGVDFAHLIASGVQSAIGQDARAKPGGGAHPRA